MGYSVVIIRGTAAVSNDINHDKHHSCLEKNSNYGSSVRCLLSVDLELTA